MDRIEIVAKITVDESGARAEIDSPWDNPESFNPDNGVEAVAMVAFQHLAAAVGVILRSVTGHGEDCECEDCCAMEGVCGTDCGGECEDDGDEDEEDAEMGEPHAVKTFPVTVFAPKKS